MLLGNNVAGLRLELAAELCAPGSELEGFTTPCCLLDRRDGLPVLVVAGAILAMQRVEDLYVGVARRL
jgi:hypothetical protein